MPQSNWLQILLKTIPIKHISLFVYCISSIFFSLGQIPETNPNINRTKNWCLNSGEMLSFNNDTVTLKSIPKGSSNGENIASYNDTQGNLLFYANHLHLFDSSNQVLNTHFPILADVSSSQGLNFIQHNDNLEWYIVTTGSILDFGVHITRVKHNSQNLNVLDTNFTLLSSCSEKLSYTNHNNNNDVWCLTHSLYNDTFYNFLLLKKGFLCCPMIQKIGSDYGNSRYPGQGMMKFSPSGRLLSVTTASNFEIELYSFNSEVGKISLESTNAHYFPYSVEFSNNENHLYVVGRGDTVFRYSILHNPKLADRTIIGHKSSDVFGQLQLSINNKIYVGQNNAYLSVIESPDSQLFVDFKIDNIYARHLSFNNYALPNFNSSYFYTPSIDFAYTEDCWGHTYSFEGRDTLGATNFLWKFVAVNSNQSLVKIGKNVNFTFPDTGKWEVTHIASTATRSDTVTKILTIRPRWKQDMLGKDTFYCEEEVANITLTAPNDMHCVHWGANGPVEEPNLDDALGDIIDYDHFHTDTLIVDTAGTYIVKVTNKTFCQAWDTITVSKKSNPNKPVVSRDGQEIVSSITAAEYRWYHKGRAKLVTSSSSLTPDSNGIWQVQLISGYGCESELSDSLHVGFASIEDVIHRASDLGFKVYPNPSDGNISIEVAKEGNYKIQIADMKGKVVYSIEQYLSLKFDFELAFAKGSYVITIIDKEGHSCSQLITVQ